MIKGSKHSDETRKKMSNFQSGRTLKESTKKKLSDLGKNKKFSDETRKKISDAKKGHTVSEIYSRYAFLVTQEKILK